MTKSDAGMLVDKVVRVKGSVSSTGVVVPTHMARRKVLVEKPVAEKPKKAAKPKAERALGDLFDAPETSKPKHEPEVQEGKRPAPDSPEVANKDVDVAAESPVLTSPAGDDTVGLDYSEPFAAMRIPDFGVPAGTSKDGRRRINGDAAMLVRMRDEKSGYDPEELSLLRKYSGNGGCGDSLNEFYTDPKVSAAMWSVLSNMGFGEGSTALEPSCATGVFLETAPRGVKVVGVEMDYISSRIGAALHRSDEVQNSSFEDFARRDPRLFDVVVGNAPFGLRGSLLKEDKNKIKTAEGYFLDTALDKLRDGGVVAMIVPTGILDSKRDRKLRENFLRKAEFLGAVRMPNTAFEHSHTEVTSDIVFFRKRPLDVAGALGAVDKETLRSLGVWDDEYLSGEYFTGRGAGNVLGTMTAGWRAKAGMGDDITVEGSMSGVPEAIAQFEPEAGTPSPSMAAIMQAVPEDVREKVRTAAVRRPYDNSKRGDTKMVDGVEYILEGEPLRWHRVDEFMQSEAVSAAQNLAAQIEAKMEGHVVGGLEERVKAYVEQYGNPSKDDNLLLAARKDKTLYRLIGAVKPDGSLSDFVSGSTPKVMASTFEAAANSLALETGWFKPEAVAARWGGGDAETALDHLYASPDYALDPKSGLWTSMDQYLSGELWPKLDEAKAELAGDTLPAADRAKVERQAKALEETIAPRSLEDVEVAINSAFIPLPIIAAFFNHVKNDSDSEWLRNQPDLSLTFEKGIYTAEGGSHDKNLLLKYLNRTGVRKEDDLPVIERWNREFKEWLCSSKYRNEVEELYNRKFRGFRQRAYSDKPFEIPGLNAEGLKDYQYGGLRWALETGKGIIAADVGLGKTARALMLARLAKMHGHAKKPIIIVPKTLIAKWVAETQKWFPGATVLTIGETVSRDKKGELVGKTDSAAERNRKLHDFTQNEYDFVIITQPAWNDIDLDPETKAKYVGEDFWVQRGDALGNAGDKRIRAARESYDQSVAGREFQKRTDAIYFNDLGADMIIGDEMHAYKNLYAARNRFGEQPKFLGGQGLSNRALDMNLKARWVREHNGGKNVYGLTATPTKNSPLEIYSMLSHIAPEAFEAIGIRNSEEFLDRFCEFKTENILNTRGEIEESLVVTGFKNLNELREVMLRYIDRKTAEDVGLQLPARDERKHLVDMSPQQEEVYATLRELAKEASSDASGDAHIFSVMDKMQKAALDLEIYSPGVYKGAVSPKYDACAKEAAEQSKEGGQIIFCDNVDAHEKMASRLVAHGIPRSQIGIINAQAAKSSIARQNIADAYNAGKLRFVIGNTATMGEGVDLQIGTTDIHHLDLPWEPASMQQRNGRGVRQGNISEAVRLHSYMAKGSFDGYRYQSMMAKKDWQDLLWNGGDRVENLAREGSVGRDELLIMLAANPEEARKQMDENKAAAQLRLDSAKFADASENFVRFQTMRRNYNSLRDKKTPAAERLRVTVSRLRDGLEASDHFKSKWALDSKEPVLLNPTNGEAFSPGHAMEFPEGTFQGGGKFIVTAVMPQISAVKVRRYGAPDDTVMLVGAEDMRKAKTIEYDAAAEKSEVQKNARASAEAKIAEVGSIEALRTIPHEIVQENYDNLQRKMKQGMKDYKFTFGYGAIGMMDKEGNPVAAEGYDANGMADTHDFMLPTQEHREKAMAAYVAEEGQKRWTKEVASTKRGRGSYSGGDMKDVIRWPGKHGDAHSNRWGDIGGKLFGASFADEARERYHRQQYEAARHAPTLGEAVKHLAMTAHGSWGFDLAGGWTKRAMATLFARAKKEGKLDEKMSAIVPKRANYGRETPEIPMGVFTGERAEGNVSHLPVREALMQMATARNHRDLAAAMAVAGSPAPEDAVRSLFTIKNGGDAVADALMHLIQRHPEMASRKAGEFMGEYDRRVDPRTADKTLADVAEDRATATEAKDAA